jgi:AcrR family transcriptional regulator
MSQSSARPKKKQSTERRLPSDSGRSTASVQNPRDAVAAPVGPPDRRVLRTQRALREALIRLVLERGWDDVSVQEVCERADVGRSTFYVHFADKEELLLHGFGDLRKALREHLAPDGDEPLGFTTALIEHAREYEPLFKVLVGRRTAVVVQRAFMDVVRDLVAEDLGLTDGAVTPERELAVSFVAGAFWEVLRAWLDRRSRLSPAEVGALFKRMAMPVIRGARRSTKG